MTTVSFLRGVACLPLVALLMGGCTLSALHDQVLQQKPIDNLANNLYVAADTLKTSAESRLNERTVIAIVPLRDAAVDASPSSSFGSHAAGIVAERFAQLGFSVRDDRTVMSAPGSVQRPAALPVTHVPATGRIPEARVEGTYTVHDQTIGFALQMVDAQRGTILARSEGTANRTDSINAQLGRDWRSIIRNSFNLGDAPPPVQPVGQAGGNTPAFEEVDPLPTPRPVQAAPGVPASSPPAVEAVPLLR